jgi:outer membrane lipoprotein SlyB
MIEEMFNGGSMWAGVVSGGFNQMQHTRALQTGQINKQQYAVHTTTNVTGAVGIMAGIEYGAMLGTAVMPGIGTIAGSIIGGMMGDRVGRYVGQKTGHAVFSRDGGVASTVGEYMD